MTDNVAPVHYSTSWSIKADATALGGSLHRTRTFGAPASYTFSGREIAWIAARGPGYGKARDEPRGPSAGLSQ